MADELIERVLFLGKVHCYAVPPLTANKGYKASEWRIDDPNAVIFTARIRVIESSDIDGGNVKNNIRLEDPNSGELFANGPYEGTYCVIPVTDSSRFFAIRVVDGTRRAFLGVGFEERSDAFDFGVCLQEVRRHNNMEDQGGPKGNSTGKTTYGTGKTAATAGGQQTLSGAAAAIINEPPKDYSLKEGQTISITIGNKGRRRPATSSGAAPAEANSNSFPLSFLPPPPSADDVKKKRQSMTESEMASDTAFTGIPSPPTSSRNNSGFDDEFGDFV